MIIDFTNKKLLTESWMRAMASWDKTFLKYLEDNTLKFIIRGEQKDVQAYAKAIMAEKEDLDAYIQFGEDHFQSKKKKALLDQAVSYFEQTTGIRWPFQD